MSATTTKAEKAIKRVAEIQEAERRRQLAATREELEKLRTDQDVTNVLRLIKRGDLVRRLDEGLPNNATLQQIEGVNHLVTFIRGLPHSAEAKKARRRLAKAEQERKRLIGVARTLGAKLPDEARIDQIQAAIDQHTPKSSSTTTTKPKKSVVDPTKGYVGRTKSRADKRGKGDPKPKTPGKGPGIGKPNQQGQHNIVRGRAVDGVGGGASTAAQQRRKVNKK